MDDLPLPRTIAGRAWLSGTGGKPHIRRALAKTIVDIEDEAIASVRQQGEGGVLELRLVVTAADYDEAIWFYRDTLGMPQLAAFTSPGARVAILGAGVATLEIADPPHADYIDEVEVGRRVAGHLRVALQVDKAAEATERAVAAGAELVAPPTETPWRSVNARLIGPADLHLTLFEELDR